VDATIADISGERQGWDNRLLYSSRVALPDSKSHAQNHAKLDRLATNNTYVNISRYEGTTLLGLCNIPKQAEYSPSPSPARISRLLSISKPKLAKFN
jgi:hypothetical protein